MNRLTIASALAFATTLPVLAQTNTYPFPASGNIGIGTTNPASHLDIQENGQHLTFLINKKLTGSWPASAEPTTMTLQSSGSSAGNLAFATGNTEWMRISDAGNVGIGTTNPQSSLHLYKQNTVSRTSVQDLVYLSTTHTDIGYNGAGTGIVDFRRTYRNGTPHVINRISMIERGDSLNDFGGAITFETKALNSGFAVPVERMRIDYTGNVGIGTSEPTIKLSVAGGGGYTGVQIGTEAGGAFLRWSREGRSGDANKLNIFDQDGGATIATFQSGGNVGIGTTNPTHKLAVNGTIKAKEIIVETTGWSDYVFADGYALQPLAEVEAHIKTNKHLPGIPSAAQVAAEGVSVGELQAKLLAKIEELTLHQIAQQKLLNRQESLIGIQAATLDTQSRALASQSREVETLRSEIRSLRTASRQ